MAQPVIATMRMESHDAMYKKCSAAAIAFTRAMVNLRQMKPDHRQRPTNPKHVEKLKKSMEVEGVRKSEDLYAYIDVDDPLWGARSKAEGMALMHQIEHQNRVEGDGSVIMSILPMDVPLKITTGLHRLHAYCSYIVDNWDKIENVKPPIDPDTIIGCSFAEGLRKPAAEILAQDCACWIVAIEYIRK